MDKAQNAITAVDGQYHVPWFKKYEMSFVKLIEIRYVNDKFENYVVLGRYIKIFNEADFHTADTQVIVSF